MNIYVGDEQFRFSVAIKPADERLIEAMLGKIDKAIATAFAEFLARATSDEAVKDLVKLIIDGRIEEAYRFAERYSQPLGIVIAEALKAGGQFEVQALAPQVDRVQRREARSDPGGTGRLPPSISALFDRLPKPSIGISFDPTAPEAAKAIREAKDGFLEQFDAGQRETIRSTLAASLEAGTGPREAAREVRSVIGLTVGQINALDRYREMLNNPTMELLTSPTRDKRYDATIRKAIRDGKSLTPDKIDELVEARRRKMLRYRSELIAKEESARALSIGREQGLRQTIEASGIDPALVTREWRSVRDGHVRDTHMVMDGQKVGLDGVFVSPSGAVLRYPRDPQAPAAEVIGCRCYTVHQIGTPAR